MRLSLVLPALFGLCWGFAAAQGTVYESQGKSGPLFTDQPSAGAKPVDLPPPNIVDAPKPPPPTQPAPAAAPRPYRVLRIVAPENQGAIHSNTGAFTLQVQVQPALRVRSGDRVIVRLDGAQLAQSYTSTSIAIGEQQWASAAAVDTTEHQLQVAIVDRNGAILIESAPVAFFALRAVRRK